MDRGKYVTRRWLRKFLKISEDRSPPELQRVEKAMVFDVLDESGNLLASTNSSEELYRIICDLRSRGISFKIRSRGAYTI